MSDESGANEPYAADDESVKLSKLNLGDNLPEVGQLSLKERGEARAIANIMAETYESRVKLLKKTLLSLSEDDPYRQEFTPEGIHEKATTGSLHFTLKQSAEEMSWSDLEVLMERSADEATMVWKTIKRMAREELAYGVYAARAVLAGKSPYKRAQFGVLIEAFVRAWQPRDAIEMAMVETLVQAHVSYNEWLKAAEEAAEYSYNAIEPQVKRNEDHRWNPPRLSAQETIENAMLMADRFNRLFLRTLRQMRDLRRYIVPVTINNPKQVNIAADGGQQVNVQQKKKRTRKGSSAKTGKALK